MISCHLAVAQEKILPLEIVIVDETWTLTAMIARTDGSLMQVEIAISNLEITMCGSVTDQRVGKVLEVAPSQ